MFGIKLREAHSRSAWIMALTPRTMRVFGQIFFAKVTYFVSRGQIGLRIVSRVALSRLLWQPSGASCGAVENFAAFRGFWGNIDREWSHRLLWARYAGATLAAKWNQIKLKHNFCHRLHNEHSDSSIISGADNADSSFMIFMISHANRLRLDIFA